MGTKKKRGIEMSKLISKGIVRGAGLMNMESRINYFKVAPKALDKIMELEIYTRKTLIDKQLRELIKIRVSQINGCLYCLDMHTKSARKLKVTDEQIDQLETWNEAKIYSLKEKVAFELAEDVTLIAEKGVSDELYQRVRQHYDEKEYVDLIMIINQINMWNRIGISMGNTVK
ncbi:MAG: carboxymuconolactone decarboxylase family protein [Methanobrevibacter sp.]|nr:carboxymuconolactone decarboxylase family protein [Methanobrevibacter sp.]